MQRAHKHIGMPCLQAMEASLHCSTCVALAAGVVFSGALPQRLNTVLQSLMQGLRRCRGGGLRGDPAAAG